MRSQNALIWAGAAASAVVVAGTSTLYWTHPGFLWRNHAGGLIVASVPAEPKTQSIPPAVPATPPPSASVPGGNASNEAAASPLKPTFDVVNVDPSGEAVIAGRAAPNAKVELRDAGKAVVEATADAAGQFVIMPPTLAPGNHSLSLAVSAEKTDSEVSTTVAVSVPAPEAKAAVSAPEPEAKAAAASTNATAPAPEMRIVAMPLLAGGSRVAIRSVEADAAGGLIAKGSADPNATVRLFLNQAALTDAKTQSDGRWSLTIKHGMSPGGYVMHADVINPGDATVVASANTPFVYPAAPIPAPPMAPTAASASAEQSSAPLASLADPVIESVQTKLVATGHTLWALSKSYYGDATHYPVIYDANRAQIHNPNLIFPGQVFVVPKSDAKP
jgi:nucleoid-associated protein YgaU